MAPITMNKVLGVIKDQTSIHLAKYCSKNLADLKVAILKATSHEESPADEAYTRQILSLARSSPTCLTACVNTITRRLNKTRNCTVALKTLMLIHRLVVDGGAAFEEEIMYATKGGSQLRNAFNDRFQSGSWNYWGFICMYALYLDEWFEFRKNCRKEGLLRKMEISGIFQRTKNLQLLLQRVLACRPTGEAGDSDLVSKALRVVLKESFQLYGELTEILGILLKRFMVLEMEDCVKIPEIVSKIVKKCEELEYLYNWSGKVKITTTCDSLRVEKITRKKVEILDKLVTERYNFGKNNLADCEENNEESIERRNDQTTLEGFVEKEPDLLDLRDDIAASGCEGDKLALALFDSGTEIAQSRPAWETCKPEETTDWEAALVETASSLSQWEASLGGGFDMLMLEGMYQQPALSATAMAGTIGVGSASSSVLALPVAPTLSAVDADPFAASLAVPPPAYVQISDMERKQRSMTEEQLMWQQYSLNGMQQFQQSPYGRL